jgi:thiol-disulfide isomerase/thioredoxin
MVPRFLTTRAHGALPSRYVRRMATPSSDVTLGASPPPFALPDVTTGRIVSLAEARPAGRGLLVMFLCRHCPYVKHVEAEVARLAREYEGKLGIVAISANDAAAYPDDAPPSLKEQAARAGFTFPYLYDEAQTVARAYGAVCTPEFFLFDPTPKLAYHGRLDATRTGREPANGADLRAALDDLLAGRAVSIAQHPSVGCSIKWKGGGV